MRRALLLLTSCCSRVASSAASPASCTSRPMTSTPSGSSPRANTSHTQITQHTTNRDSQHLRQDNPSPLRGTAAFCRASVLHTTIMLRPAAARGSGAARHWDAARASSPRYGAAACGRFSAAPRSSSASSRTSSVKGAQQQSFSTSGVLHSVQRRLFQAPWVGSSREVEARPAPTRPHLPSDAATQQQRQWLDDVQQRMRAFLGPAILIPLADPLMALMDTLFVGQVNLITRGPCTHPATSPPHKPTHAHLVCQ